MPADERERPALFGAALAEVKRYFDPRGMMNPGVLVTSDQTQSSAWLIQRKRSA